MPRASSSAPRKRRAYHHGDLVAALVAEATRVVEAEGHDAVSVREIARAVGVSAAAPFRHFRDRDDLLRAVAFAGLARMLELGEQAMAEAGDDPLLRFRALGSTQIRFAVRHPNLRRLMQLPSMQAPPSTASEEEQRRLASIHETTRALVEAAQRRGRVRAGDPAVFALAGVALAYGLSQMLLEGYLPEEGGEALAESVLDVLATGVTGLR